MDFDHLFISHRRGFVLPLKAHPLPPTVPTPGLLKLAAKTRLGCFLTANPVFIQSFLFQFLSVVNLTTKHITLGFLTER